jgi:CheY-like chemotaxis protein
MTDTYEQPKPKILLVDDDNFIVTMYAAAFAESGFETHAFLTAKEALQKLRDGYPADIIIFDLRMPEQDGFSFLECVRREHLVEYALRVALTNQSTDVERDHAKELGADVYLVKVMVTPAEVVNIVKDAFTHRHES